MRTLALFAAVLVFGLGPVAASADECSGREHTRGTVLGAAGGALIGGLAGNSAGAAVAGGVVGGLTGNAISRRQDCNSHSGQYYHKGRYYKHRRYYDGRYHYW
jgi:hypothetical protein